MRDEKKERKKEANKVKQTTRQSNTAHPRQSLFLRLCIRAIILQRRESGKKASLPTRTSIFTQIFHESQLP